MSVRASSYFCHPSFALEVYAHALGISGWRMNGVKFSVMPILDVRIVVTLLAVIFHCASLIAADAGKFCTAGQYDIDIQFDWTPETDAAFPATAGTGFGTVVCLSHSKSFSLWETGSPAREEVIKLAETGDVARVIALLSKAKSQGSVFAYSKYPSTTRQSQEDESAGSADSEQVSGTQSSAADGSAESQIKPTADVSLPLPVKGSSNHTLITCISAILPSPDFFVGFTSLQSCDADNGKYNASMSFLLRAFDAGSDDGEDYTSESIPVQESAGPRSIKSLIGFADNYGKVTLSLSSGDGITTSSTSGTDKDDGTKSGCFPATERLYLAHLSDRYPDGDAVDGDSLSRSDYLISKPMHAASIGDQVLIAATDDEVPKRAKSRCKEARLCLRSTFSWFFSMVKSTRMSRLMSFMCHSKFGLSKYERPLSEDCPISYRPKIFSSIPLDVSSNDSLINGLPSQRVNDWQRRRWKASPLFAFSHADPHVLSTFIELRTASASIRLTAGHYIYVYRGSSLRKLCRMSRHCQTRIAQLTTADSVRPGDALLSPSNLPMIVESTRVVLGKGLYNPHSISGDLIVSGFRVSCYTRAVSPRFAHIALMPLRAVYFTGRFYRLLRLFSRLLWSSPVRQLSSTFLSSIIRGREDYDQGA